MSFAGLTAGADLRTDGLALSVPESWHQGRTAYGGFSGAVALAAAMRVGGEGLPPLRSATVNFIGPAYGEVEARARVLRSGRNATWIGAEVLRDGEVTCTAAFVFMGPVESALHLNDCPPPAGLVPVETARQVQFGEFTPLFLKNHFEARYAVPVSETPQPELCRWVRLAEREGLDPASEIMLIADALPPGVLPLLNARVMVSSMTWQLNLLTAKPRTRDGWWLCRSTGDYAENGCSSQVMRIWDADGVPVTSGMQSVAVFG